MFKEKFGIEIEFTGIMRSEASKAIADYLGGTINELHDYYDTEEIKAPDGRKWKVMYDGSLRCQRKVNGEIVGASRLYSCELVSPILTYDEDINTLQEIVRLLRKAGGFTNASCGIHVHLDGKDYDVRSIRNFINIIASKNDLLYKALEIKQERMRFCKKMDEHLVNAINKKHPKTLEDLADIWYEGYYGTRNTHYHDSRYHFLNLHSFFTGNHTYTCYVLSKGKDNWTLLYMASDDNYFPYYFKETPVEDILLANKNDEYLFNYLKPKVIQILPNYITIELRGKIFKVDRY